LADSGYPTGPPDDAAQARRAAGTATVGQAPAAGRRDHIDPDTFRDVMGRFVSGVTVVTTSADGQVSAATVSALTSVSLAPPMLLICLNRSSTTQDAIARSGRFAVNILAQHQHQLARWFATKETSKLDPVVTATGPGELPIIREAVAYLECAVCDTFRGGTHTIFLAKVLSGWPGRGQPLVYYRGTLGSFADIGDRALARPCPDTRDPKGRAS
jgi:flavin reductase (DIM6/NTAB) family NADH-FMN oxidoreductase RutF